jgi:SNF2 family DNA or RNA helicase
MPDVIITNYHKLGGWAGELKGKVKTVIFDEVQELRRESSQKYHAAESIASGAEFKLGLSATPIHNFGGEIWNILNVLRPWSLGHWSEFAQEWCGNFSDRSKAPIRDPKAFGSYAREAGLMLRRTRADVGRELPGLTIVPHVIDADTTKLDEIAGSAGELARVILAQGGAAFDKMRASEEFSWRLRQATGIAKGPFVADFVRLLVEDGEKVLLYGWHHEVYKIWGERLKDLNPVFFTGEESPNQKEASKRAFLEGDSKVLIMSLRAGAGIDGLQKSCRTVVFGELDWSPSVHEQATGRIFRDGQQDKVAAYFLMSDSGSDPVIADVLGVKRGQLDGIRNPTGDVVEMSQTDPNRIKRLAEDFLSRHAGSRKKQEEDAA